MIRMALCIALMLTMIAGVAGCGLLSAAFAADGENVRKRAEIIGDRVVDTYKNIEETVVGEYQRILDAFVNAYLD